MARIALNRRVICVSPAYLQRHGQPVYVNDLDEHQCIILNAAPRWPFKIDGELQHRRMNGRISTNRVDAVRTAAIQGLGIAQLAYWDVIR